jgi:hypothetical protein
MPTDSNDTLESLRAEVAALRRRSRLTLMLAGLGVLGVGLLGSGKPLQVLRTDRIEVRPNATNPEDAQGIVIEHAGEDGPTITLRDGEGRIGRLTLNGLELSTRVAQPDKLPTLDDPGLGEVGPDEDTVRTRFTIDGAYVTHVTVTCTPGFRARARFVDGSASLAIPSSMSTCVAVFGGGSVASRVSIEPGGELACRKLHDGSSNVFCEPTRAD